MSATSLEQTLADLNVASGGFDDLFANDLDKARDLFKAGDSPFHLIGLGIIGFLEAALGMEVSRLIACVMGR